MKKIGILGSGPVGKTLAVGLREKGFEIMIGTRNLENLSDWSKETGCKTGTFQETASFGDMLVLAAKGRIAEDVLYLSGRENIEGKIIMDATNPIADEPHSNGVLKFFTNLDDSLMERLQYRFPESRFVKSFNSIGSAFMVNPDFGGTKPSMFICGNDDEAKKEVTNLLEILGWEAEDMGKAEAARAIEPLSMLWCIPGFINNKWSHAFKLLKK
jgi:8-hydroxy-5-deazaflavin:NADPH oxidoreductase